MKPVHTEYSKVEHMIFPEAINLSVLLSGKQTNGTVAIFEDIVEPGVGPGRHIHYHQDETFFFLEGEFIAEVAGVMYTMSPGDVAFIPRGTIHAFKNVGSTPGRLRYVFSPALNIEEMFREMYAALDQGEFNMEVMDKIAEKHGQGFVGPPL